jgi:hypothetical protein
MPPYFVDIVLTILFLISLGVIVIAHEVKMTAEETGKLLLQSATIYVGLWLISFSGFAIVVRLATINAVPWYALTMAVVPLFTFKSAIIGISALKKDWQDWREGQNLSPIVHDFEELTQPPQA